MADFAPVCLYGKYLLIQIRRDDVADIVACLTEVSLNDYPAAFRSHTGRWKPLPAAGDLQAHRRPGRPFWRLYRCLIHKNPFAGCLLKARVRPT